MIDIEKLYADSIFRDIVKREAEIKAILESAIKELSKRIANQHINYPDIMKEGMLFRSNKGVERQITKTLERLYKEIDTAIQRDVKYGWNLANQKNSELVAMYTQGIKISQKIITSYNNLNLEALNEFLKRTEAGLNLSKRIWNLTEATKSQIELYLGSGISAGKSAAGISIDIRNYLNEPHKLFRRVRVEGKLVLSKAAKAYPPGSGVYRSSYKNALRLSANETNLAYRLSDFTRRQQMPFVTGIEVHLSASHEIMDMCFISGQYRILTSKGWIPIYKIKENDLVLTHKGKFRRVTKKYKTTTHKVKMRTIEYKCEYDSRAKSNKISSTENHPFLINNKWIPAKDIKVGDKVKILASRCKWCGKLIPYYREYCSKSCASKAITKKQWSDPNHRENISKKAKKRCKGGIPYFKDWVDSGKNVDNLINPENRQKAIKNLMITMREKVKNGTHPFQQAKNNIKAMKKLAQNKNSTFIEKKMEWLLKQKGIKYIHTYPFERDVYRKNGDKRLYFIDFVLTDYKIALECDGWYWHQDKEKDLKRQKEIENKGFTVLRFTDNEIRKHLNLCSNEIDRVINNHSGNYEFMNVKITKIKDWTAENKAPITKYNLAVEEDNSFVIKGFVVHNCDDLQGRYPKGFVFGGWHVGCFCYSTSILLNKREFIDHINGGKIRPQRYVRTIPKTAENWIEKNKGKIAKYKTKPYFVRDNLTEDFKVKKSILKVK